MPFVTVEHMDQGIVIDATQAVSGVAGILNGAKAVAFTNVLALTKTTAFADLVIPAGHLATPLAITWGAAFRDSSGHIGIDSNVLTFTITGGDAPAVIRGVAVVDSTGAVLLMACNLDAPYPLNNTLDALNCVAHWVADNAQPGTVEVL